ncbi:MAG: glycosyl hydrolase family 28-related protein [Paracoccaceae bacterium]
MNKAITDGLVLMPPAFSEGLALWSREDGLTGQGSWLGQGNAAYVSADADFAGCLEIQKTASTTKLRCFQSIPFMPGLYLQVTVRVKAISGALPSVRIAGWAGNSAGTNVASAQQTGPSVALTSYGQVVTLRAIIGSGNRSGVDMVWGTAPVVAHLGLDLTGANGGVVRIDDITVEDVTAVFHTQMMDWVDVRDYGAIGNGVTDDRAAFEAADTAAGGRTVVVSKGSFYIGSHLTLESPVRFEGGITMPETARLLCKRNFNLDTYTAAFGTELAGFRKALQALFYNPDHVVLDLSGKRVDIDAPLDVAAIAGLTSFSQRRVITNGQLNANDSTAWDTQTATSVATYAVAQPLTLTGVANVANVPVGARVSGTGVGREVYVVSKDTGAGTVTLSQPLWAAAGTRTFTFSRYRYMLDFSGFTNLSKFEITAMELQANGLASAVMLAQSGDTFRMADCVINRPRDRGVTSTGGGCQGIMIDQCQFLSNEQALKVADRTSIALNVNANDAKIRNNRVVRFAHFAVLCGTSNMIIGNHFFQGDGDTAGTRRAGIVFTLPNLNSVMTGNYVDNCFIELSNEHTATPAFTTGYSFGGLSVTGNIFIAIDVGAWFRWIVVAPKGAGHFINGLMVSDNSFRTIGGVIDRVEMVDTTNAALNYGMFRNVVFQSNTFNGISQLTVSPVTVAHTQNTAAATWTVDAAAYLPFGGRARNVTSVLAEGMITNASGTGQYVMPYVQVEQGTGGTQAALRWPSAVKGKMQVTLRVDNPV